MFPADSQTFSQQVDRIMKSHSLRGADSLSRLLQYCAKQSIEHPDELLKEYQIAREVFGRGPDFDPQSDSCVRVQAGRLRLKLADYYATEGANDPVVVKLPKGGYHLIFETKSNGANSRSGSAAEPAETSSTVSAPSTVSLPFAVPALWRFALIASLICLFASLVVVATLLWGRKQTDPPVASAHEVGAPRPLAEFWKPFTSGEEPWVIYSNAAFAGRPETGMHYYNAGKDSKSPVYDHYTGVGEVLAIHDLDAAFAELGRHIRVKRGSLFSLDDTRNANLIFVGSPSENLSLQDIPASQEFVFQRASTGPRKGDLEIVSKHPKPGEAVSYMASPSGSPITEDYAVVVFVPGVTTERVVMILAGTTTFGTQGAAEFVSTPDSVAKLMQELPGSDKQMKPFEALLHVKIAREVPVDTELIAVRSR